MKIKGKVFVVTGGGSGMGQEMALKLLEKGAKVAIADIKAEGMAETARKAGALSENLTSHILNISDRASVEAFPQVVMEAHGVVDAIVNNAGIIQPFVPVNDLEYDKIERIINVNFYGTLYMIKSFLPHLLKRPEAHITNISSMGGFIPFPGQTFYGASKAAVKLLSEGLYAELKDTNVGVTVVHPGAINTNIMANSGVELEADPADSKDSPAYPALAADKAAEIIIGAIEKSKFRVMVGSDARFLDILYRLNPRRAVNYIVKKMSNMV
jgi:NAD(P)-dependent dehydrogenase (short-subunit alcohol dehydrogenase family)